MKFLKRIINLSLRKFKTIWQFFISFLTALPVTRVGGGFKRSFISVNNPLPGLFWSDGFE